MKFKNLDPRAIGQWAACDIYTILPQCKIFNYGLQQEFMGAK